MLGDQIKRRTIEPVTHEPRNDKQRPFFWDINRIGAVTETLLQLRQAFVGQVPGAAMLGFCQVIYR